MVKLHECNKTLVQRKVPEVRERERKTRSLHVTVAKRTAEQRTEVYTRRPVINVCIWRGKETFDGESDRRRDKNIM